MLQSFISLKPKRLLSVLLALATLISGLGAIAAHLAVGRMGESVTVDRLFNFFHLNVEANLPTWYSSLLLFACAIALLFIAQSQRQRVWSWRGLAGIFLFLSLDETAQIHEMLTGPSRDLFKTSGALYFAWIIPYGAALLVLALTYIRFYFRLERRLQYLFAIAATLFVGGALGIEVLEGIWFERYGARGWKFILMTTTEEFCEMAGISVFLYALVSKLSEGTDSLIIGMKSSNESPEERSGGRS